MIGFLPAKFHIRFLPPVPTDDTGEAPWEDTGLVRRGADEVRDTIQSHVLDMVGGGPRSGSRTARSASRHMPSHRILITGVSTYWGGRLAQALEADDQVETVIGVDRNPPKVELRRAEFAQVADSHSLIRRIVDAVEIDTVVDTRLWWTRSSPRRACPTRTTHRHAQRPGRLRRPRFAGAEGRLQVERALLRFFTEDMVRPHPPRTSLERDILDAERSVRDFSSRHPDATVTVLRFANSVRTCARRGAACSRSRSCP